MFQNQEVNYASDGNKYSRMYTEVEVKSHHHMLCVTKSFHSQNVQNEKKKNWNQKSMLLVIRKNKRK